MRILPCKSGKCGDRPALATPTIPLCMGSLPDPVHVYKCVRCKLTSRITSTEFMALPMMTVREILDAGFVLDDLNDPRAADYVRSERP